MAKRKNQSITETIAQHLETTTEMPEVVGVPEEQFQSVFEEEEKEQVKEEKPEEEEQKVENVAEEVKEEPKDKTHQPLSPHHVDSLTSEINTSLNSIF